MLDDAKHRFLQPYFPQQVATWRLKVQKTPECLAVKRSRVRFPSSQLRKSLTIGDLGHIPHGLFFLFLAPTVAQIGLQKNADDRKDHLTKNQVVTVSLSKVSSHEGMQIIFSAIVRGDLGDALT